MHLLTLLLDFERIYMKTLFYIIVIHLIFVTSVVYANQQEHIHNHNGLTENKQVEGIEKITACENIVDVKVNGLVCDFCARALEKVFGKRDEVSGIDVDLDNGKVSIAMKEGKSIDDATLTKLIKNSGYNVVALEKGC